MADIGLEFSSDSFKEFNKTLKEFTKVSQKVDEKLSKIALGVNDIIVSTRNSQNFGHFVISFGTFINLIKSLQNKSSNLNKLVESLTKLNNIVRVIQIDHTSNSLDKLNDAFRRFNAISVSTEKIADFGKGINNLIKIFNRLIKGTDLDKFLSNNKAFNKFLTDMSHFTSSIKEQSAERTSKMAVAIKGLINSLKLFEGLNLNLDKLKTSAIAFKQFQEMFTGGVGIRNQIRRLAGWFSGVQNLSDILQNLGTVNILHIKDFANGVRILVESMQALGKIDLKALNFQAFEIAFRNFARIFTGFTGVRGAWQKLTGFFTGRLGIAEVLSKLGTIKVVNFTEFSRGIHDLVNAVQSFSKQKIDVAGITNNSIAIKKFLNIFTGGTSLFARVLKPFDILIGGGGIIDKLSTFKAESINSFRGFARGVKSVADTFDFIGKMRIDAASIRAFGSAVDLLIKTMAKVVKGGLFGTGLFSRRQRDLEEMEKALRTLEKLSKIRIDVQNIEAALSLPGLPRKLGDTGDRSANALIQKFKQKLRISSPSRVFEIFGQNILQGLERGFRAIAEIVRNVVNKIISAFSGIKSKVANFFESRRAARELKDLERQSRTTTNKIAGLFQNLSNRIILSLDIGNIISSLWNRISPSALMSSFIEFEDAFVGVVKTLDTSGLSETEAATFISELEQDIRNMAIEGGVLSGLENAHVTIANIAEAAGSLGIAREDLAKFTEVVGAMSLATNLSADDAATFFGQFSAITQSTDFDRIGATMVGLGNSFAATETQIADFALRLAGAGTSAGLSEADILGVGAAMASVGINAEAGGTAMTQVFNEIAKASASNSKELRTYAKIAGVAPQEFATMWEENAVGALDLFTQGLGKLDNAQRIKVLDELGLDGARVADVLTRLGNSGDNLTEAIRIANEEWEKNAALMAEAEKRAQTTRAAVNRMKNNFFDLKVTVGEILNPVFLGFVNTITGLVSKTNEWLKANKQAILSIYPKISKFIEDFTRRFKQFGLIIKNIGLPGYIRFLKDLNSAFRILFSGNSRAALDKFKQAFSGLGETFEKVSKATGKFFKRIGGKGIEDISKNPVLNRIKSMFEAIKDHDWEAVIQIGVQSVKDIISTIFQRLGFGSDSESDMAVVNILRARLEAAGDPENFTEAVDKVILGLRLALEDIANGDFSQAEQFIEDHISQIFRTALGGIITAVFGFPVGTVFSLANLLVSAIQSDFLGIRGFLEQSTVGQSIIDLADGINSLIEDAFAGLFGNKEVIGEREMSRLAGKKEMSLGEKIKEALFGEEVDFGENVFIVTLQGIVDRITEIVDTIRNIDFTPLQNLISSIANSIGTLASGALAGILIVVNNFVLPAIQKFVDALDKFISSIDEETITGFVTTMGIFIGLFIAPAFIHFVGVMALVSGIANSVGDFASALSSLFSAIGIFIETGDPGAALQKVGEAIAHIWNGVKNFVQGAVQPFIDLFNKLIEAAGFDFRLISVEQAFKTLEIVAMGVLITLQRTLEDIGFKLAFQFNDLKIRGLQALKDMNIATGDQLLQLDQATAERNALIAVDTINKAIFRAAQTNKFDPNQIISFEQWDGSQFVGTIQDALNNPEVISRLSGSSRTLLLNMAKEAFTGTDGAAIADALNIFRILGEQPPTGMGELPPLIASSFEQYKNLIAAEYKNVVLEATDPAQIEALFAQQQAGLLDVPLNFVVPPEKAGQFGNSLITGLTQYMEQNPVDMAGWFDIAQGIRNFRIEDLEAAGIDVAATLRQAIADEFAITGDAFLTIDQFLPLIDLTSDPASIQKQFNEQLALLTQNMSAEDAITIGEALEIQLEEIVLAGTGATIDLQVDQDAINQAGQDAMIQNGLNVATGLLQGVVDFLGLGTLTTEAINVFNRFDQAFKDAAGISSPSSVFVEHGQNLVQGLVNGVSENLPSYQESVDVLKLKMTELGDHVTIIVDNFKIKVREIPDTMLDIAIQFSNGVLIFGASALIFGITLDTIANKVDAVADKVAILASELARVGLGMSLLGFTLPGEDDKEGGLASGGDVKRGKVYEVLENNLPFEVFKSKGKKYFISNEDGIMLSPLTAQAIGASAGSTTNVNNTSGDVILSFNVNSQDPQEIVRIARSEFEKITKKKAKEEIRVRRRTGVYGL